MSEVPLVPSDLRNSELALESSFTEGCRYHYNALGQMDSTLDSRVGIVVDAYDAIIIMCGAHKGGIWAYATNPVS